MLRSSRAALARGIALVCVSVQLACAPGARRGERTAAPAPPEPATPSAPVIRTYIFEEYAGADTLSLKHVIPARGYLKRGLPARVSPEPGDRFVFTLLTRDGDTIAQSRAASALAETLETSDESGALIAVDVAHAVAAHTLRHVGPVPHSIAVTTFGQDGAVVARQRFVPDSEGPPAPDERR